MVKEKVAKPKTEGDDKIIPYEVTEEDEEFIRN